MQFSHSRVETFENCPYRYKLTYVDKLKVLPNVDEATNALFLGTGLHEGVEKGVTAGIQKYFDSYPIITDLHINEAIKLEHWIPKVRVIVSEMCNGKNPIFERMITHPDLIGFMDLLIPIEENGVYKKYALYDFKYSNHVDRYLESRQLHEYKYFFEKLHPYSEIVEMGYIFIPKTAIRQKKTEDLFTFRKRLQETLDGMEIKTVKVEYNPNKVIDFYQRIKEILECTNFEKKECKLCDFCDYKLFCQQGEDYMLLPKNERRTVNPASRKKVWLYGAPFSGKTTLADQFPDPLFLNTDGNLNSFTGQVVEIKDTLNGRQTVTAWENFEAVIDELAKGSEFKTIVVDLLEDTYEHCRQFMYKEMGITHESDSNFKAWDMVLNRYLTSIKKLTTLPYNIVFISHEDMTKDITKRSGDKITAIKPNLRDKVATKVSGMVDIVARVVCEDGVRTLQFKSDDIVFGGGRLKLDETVIPLTHEALEGVYENQGTKVPTTDKEVVQNDNDQSSDGESDNKVVVDDGHAETKVNESLGDDPKDAPWEEEKPVRRTRRTRKTAE